MYHIHACIYIYIYIYIYRYIYGYNSICIHIYGGNAASLVASDFCSVCTGNFDVAEAKELSFPDRGRT